MLARASTIFNYYFVFLSHGNKLVNKDSIILMYKFFARTDLFMAISTHAKAYANCNDYQSNNGLNLRTACSGVNRPVFRSKPAGLPEQSRPP